MNSFRLNLAVFLLTGACSSTSDLGSNAQPNDAGPNTNGDASPNTSGASTTGMTSMTATGPGTTGGAGGTGGADPTTTGGGTSGTGGGGASGGSGGQGGSAQGGMGGSSGAAGKAGGGAAGTLGGAGGGGPTVQEIVPTLDGFLWVAACSNGSLPGDCAIYNDTGTQCVFTGSWSAMGAFKIKKHTVGGTPGTKYLINFEVRGVTGGKTYDGGTRQSTAATFNQTGNDGWYVGGSPTETKWNTYEIHVNPPVPGQPVTTAATAPSCAGCPPLGSNIYYANMIPDADGVREPFPIGFKASFPVLGGSTITLLIHDSNCLAQQNCGGNPDPGAPCDQSRTIDLSGLSPLPANFTQPYSQQLGSLLYPQWLLFDVQSVTQL